MATKTRTPEWTLTDAGPNSGNIVRGEIMDGDKHIADLIDAADNGGMTAKEWERNSGLIVAAHKMLKLISQMVAICDSYGDGIFVAEMRQARAIISQIK